MVFDSLVFLVFFAVVLGLYASSLLTWRGKKIMLTVASYLFYAAWDPVYVLLLWISTVVDWFAGNAMGRATTWRRKRVLLLLSLTTNLGMLAYFKYGGFLLQNLGSVFESVGFEYEPATWSIVLPVGISFYTFQTLSYTLDIYRNDLEPSQDFVDFALFVTFFPQLVAGPIVRAADFLPQLLAPRKVKLEQVGWA